MPEAGPWTKFQSQAAAPAGDERAGRQPSEIGPWTKFQTEPPAKEPASPRSSALSGYLQGSWEGVKEAGRDTLQAGKDIGQALMGGDPSAALRDVGAAAMFASGGLTSPIGPQRSGPLARGDRARMGNSPPAKSVSVEDFLKKADEKKGGDQKGGASSMSVGEMAHLLHAVLRHDPIAIARIATKYLSDRPPP